MAPAQDRAAPADDNDDAEGFDAFYLATFKRTFAAAYRMSAGNHDVAEEATQEAYVALWLRWPQRRQLPMNANLKYVIGIASHKVVDRYRSQDAKRTVPDEVDGPADEPTPADALGELAVLRAVRDLLEGQSSRRRAVGMLYFLEGWEQAEIAEALGMAASTVRTHVQRLRVLLKPLIHRINDLDSGGDHR
ncbi:RNA polymerase sigma factor [Amycolatopsis sp. FU40]|uniref:RNA polymerase sigma factor n=1 Tax=Amycolatopsis sp. FU40 TaxID=2914159 RepID=UPI001F338431|nr:RNA polymerase sigma factor [Amycolatopsis sp. FU40]UKD51088.1 RNA polymerase sigma factor [Amycolatopsis sp. FU40]